MVVTVEECLQGPGDGKGVPVTLLDLQHLFYHQGAVSAGHPTIYGKEDSGGQAGVPVRVLRGAGVDPQRGLKDLDALATFLQKLEGKAEAGLISTPCLPYGSMTN